MKVVVCGAGQVGLSIAAYLSEEGNNVVVVDQSPERIALANETLKVTGLVGHAAHPDVLKKAGLEDADMLIAATQADEVNMVACQIAHSLFNVTTKVARIREQSYLDPEWKNLFHRDHMPINAVISPEVEVAKAIANRIRVPGAYNIIPLADGLVQLVGVICKEACPIVRTPLKHLTSLFPDLSIVIQAIVRNEEKIIPDSNEELLPGDEVYFVCSTEHLSRCMASFGYDDPVTRKVLIIGGGKIGTRLAEEIKERMPQVTVTIIEGNHERARYIAELHPDITVLQGDGLDRALLEEAGINQTETVISVMNHDESNILSAMLAKQTGCERTIALVNNGALTTMVANLEVDAVVNPRTITVSTILQHIRMGRIKAAHAIRDGFAEILEMEALDSSAIVNTPIRDIRKPKDMIFGVIIREKQVLLPRPDMVIRPDDRVIILAAHDEVKRVEQMFAVRPEYF